jgi:hypothetical protein
MIMFCDEKYKNQVITDQRGFLTTFWEKVLPEETGKQATILTTFLTTFRAK